MSNQSPRSLLNTVVNFHNDPARMHDIILLLVSLPYLLFFTFLLFILLSISADRSNVCVVLRGGETLDQVAQVVLYPDADGERDTCDPNPPGLFHSIGQAGLLLHVAPFHSSMLAYRSVTGCYYSVPVIHLLGDERSRTQVHVRELP